MNRLLVSGLLILFNFPGQNWAGETRLEGEGVWRGRPFSLSEEESTNAFLSVRAHRYFWMGLRDDESVVVEAAPGIASDLRDELTAIPEGLSGVVEIACGEKACLVRKEGGTVACWGAADSPIVEGFPEGRLRNIVSIGCGHDFAFALDKEGALTVWGRFSRDGQKIPREFLGDVRMAAATWDSIWIFRKDGSAVRAWRRFIEPLEGDFLKVETVSGGRNHLLLHFSSGEVRSIGSDRFRLSRIPEISAPISRVRATQYNGFLQTDEGEWLAWGRRDYPFLLTPEDDTVDLDIFFEDGTSEAYVLRIMAAKNQDTE